MAKTKPETFLGCPYCGSELRESFDTCCGEAGHGERLCSECSENPDNCTCEEAEDYQIKPQLITSGVATVESQKFVMLTGKSGHRWFMKPGRFAADLIYVEGAPNDYGFGGAVLNFQLEDGTSVNVKGPWHSNAEQLYYDTGVDVTMRHSNFTVLALGYNPGRDLRGTLLDVQFKDEAPVESEYHRTEDLAQRMANRLNRRIYYYGESAGGSRSGWADPKV